jgi:hypothetical protein
VTVRLAAGLLVLVLASGADAAREKVGVFGKVAGKKFSAPAVSNGFDGCIGATVSGPSFALGAAECRGPKLRRRTKRDWKQLNFACAVFGGGAITPPQDLPCIAAAYIENKNSRGRRPGSSKTWSASVSYSPTGAVSSTVTVRVEAIENGFVRGSFSGVFDQPAPGAGPAPIQSGTFYVPLQP